MAASGHFGYPKITFSRISGHFRSIQHFFFTKWLPVAILDVRKSLSISFLAISDRYATLFCLEIFDKMAAVGHFECPKFIFGSHFWPFYNNQYLLFSFFFVQKWLPVPILDVRKSISISFLSISHRYATLIFLKFLTMADVGHFGCPNFTFNRISGHFRSIGHFGFPKFTFDRNSRHFRSIQIFFFGGHFVCLKITLDRISGHFRLIGHFGCPKFIFDGISGHFRSIRLPMAERVGRGTPCLL